MDVHLQGNSQLHYGVNEGARRNTRTGGDEALQFLSQEEQECIQFFEETIDSLEESLVEDDQRSTLVKPPERRGVPLEQVNGLATSNVPSHQDIIDLVHPEPDLVQTKEPSFNPTNPDFQRLLPTPESHFGVKPRRDSLPSEYNPPLPSGSYRPTDSHSSYHPPGCIPTPVLIAQKIAENQGGGTSNLQPSSFLRRLSLESEKLPSDGAESPVRQGPPTSAKPTRFPANISVILGNKEHQKQPVANVNIQERRGQMLANLSGTSHPLLLESSQQTAEEKARNTPTRSISFKDPSPDKSRMEALSKLGLTRNRAMSGETSLQVPNSTTVDSRKGPETGSKSPETCPPPLMQSGITVPDSTAVTSPLSHIHVDKKPEILQTHSLRSYDGRSSPLSPPSSTSSPNRPYPPPPENKASAPPPAEVASLEFNNYGGKSIMVNPSVSSKSEPVTLPTSQEAQTLPSALSNPTELNTYGGKSKVMTPAPAPVTRANLPDILSSHIDRSHTMPAKPEPLPAELNTYGGKSRSFNPITGLNITSGSPAKSAKAPAPAPAPRMGRYSYHGGLNQKPGAPPEHKRRSNSMFRPQGITVQFSGRGEMNESRREALRKLGLLKDS